MVDQTLSESERLQPPRWALLIVAVGLIAAVFTIFSSALKSDAGRRVIGQPTTMSNEGLITTMQPLLDEPELGNLVGREVVLDGVQVQSVIGDYAFWIGSSAHAQVPAVLMGELTGRQPDAKVEVRPGQRLLLFGVVRRMRGADFIEEAWALSDSERQSLEGARLYVSALRVQVLE